MGHQYRAPTANGAVLAEPPFDALPALVEANRARLNRDDVQIGGLPLRQLRALARHEVLALAGAEEKPSAPLLLSGHQPELSHPGVWVKNFAINGLARKLNGIPLHLVVDNDTLKSTSLRFPTFREGDADSVRMESLPFDALNGESPYEDRTVKDRVTFSSFARRTAEVIRNWPEPMLWRLWPSVIESRTIAEAFTTLRRKRELAWGCNNLEVPVSRLSQTEAFAKFAQHILRNLPRFREVYNKAILDYRAANGIRSENHPAPELAEGEAPFWIRTTTGRRERATPTSDVRTLRPRAFTLTLFARVCLGDFFIHGIGGGKYDEVTDAIIRDYFGIEPPAFQVLSATLHLPLPAFPSSVNDLKQAERRVRDLQWNPQFYLSDKQRVNPEVKALLDSHASLSANEPPYVNHAARREWFRALKEVKERLRVFVTDQVPQAEAELKRIRSEVNANAILQRRDYAWVLYPEDALRSFMENVRARMV